MFLNNNTLNNHRPTFNDQDHSRLLWAFLKVYLWDEYDNPFNCHSNNKESIDDLYRAISIVLLKRDIDDIPPFKEKGFSIGYDRVKDYFFQPNNMDKLLNFIIDSNISLYNHESIFNVSLKKELLKYFDLINYRLKKEDFFEAIIIDLENNTGIKYSQILQSYVLLNYRLLRMLFPKL